jgi:hypothetical protein
MLTCFSGRQHSDVTASNVEGDDPCLHWFRHFRRIVANRRTLHTSYLSRILSRSVSILW